MPPKKKIKGNSGVENANPPFSWTDDELELLLGVIQHYKSDKEGEGYDWESVKTKYPDIMDRFIDRYPKETDPEGFPRKEPGKDFTKERIVPKVKSMRQKYRTALDSGRRSGGGRIVAQFFDVFSKIWGGNPATESIVGGIDTSDSTGLSLSDSSTEQFQDLSATCNTADEGPPTTSACSGESPSSRNIISDGETPRRSPVAHMKDAINAKLRKPISNEKQLLDLAKENLSLKRKMMEEMKEVNKEYTSNMAVLTNTLVGLTSAVTNALSMSGFQAQPPLFLQPTHYLSYAIIVSHQMCSHLEECSITTTDTM